MRFIYKCVQALFMCVCVQYTADVCVWRLSRSLSGSSAKFMGQRGTTRKEFTWHISHTRDSRRPPPTMSSTRPEIES